MSGFTKEHLGQLRKQVADVTYNHEKVTRPRLEALEAHAQQVGALLTRSLWGRLVWLLRGR